MNRDYYNALKKMIDSTRTDCLLELRVGIKGKITVYDLANEKPISTIKCIIIWLKNKCDFSILTDKELNALLQNRK